MPSKSTPIVAPPVRPADALRPGRFDPTVVLVLWCVRKSFFSILVVGLTIALVAYQDAADLEAQLDGFDTPAALWSNLLSPLAGLVVAVLVRIVANLAGLVAAYPLTRWTKATDYATQRRRRNSFRLWMDRIFMARSFRALRWTSAVRMVAADRLGETGRTLRACDNILTWVAVAAVVGLVATSAVIS